MEGGRRCAYGRLVSAASRARAQREGIGAGCRCQPCRDKAEKRLTKRFKWLLNRVKPSNIVVTASAREMLGFFVGNRSIGDVASSAGSGNRGIAMNEPLDRRCKRCCVRSHASTARRRIATTSGVSVVFVGAIVSGAGANGWGGSRHRPELTQQKRQGQPRTG